MAYGGQLVPVRLRRVNDLFMGTDVYVFLAGISGSVIAAGGTMGAVVLNARRMAKAGRLERRRQAYADLLVAAGDVLGTYRRDVDALSPDFGRQEADEANAQMANLRAALHRASAIVALTGSELGRQQGKRLYETAKGVAASPIVPTGDPNYPYTITAAEDKALETAIDEYKAALVPETTALP